LPPSLGSTQNFSGSIFAAQGYQEWKFTGLKGDIITIRMLRDNNVSLRLHVSLTDNASGQRLSESDCYYGRDDARVQNYKLPLTGSYTIRADGCDGTTGAYTLSLVVKLKPVMLTYGQQAGGTLPVSNDYQDWVFNGAAGDIITIRMLRDNNVSLRLHVSLTDNASGQRLSESDCYYGRDDARVQNYKLPLTGSYTIRADGCDGTTGAFTLSLAKG
jgi:hypothetical protein